MLLLILVVTGSLFWLAGMRARDIAVLSAGRECKRQGVQLLDQSVQQARLSMSRDSTDRWRFWREYRFEYSDDGETRSNGRLVLLGHRVTHIHLDTFPTIH